MSEEMLSILTALAVGLGLWLLARLLRRPKARKNLGAGLLDQVLFWWTPQDSYCVRDLLNGGALVVGISGSGKTSSSGRTLGQAIVDHPRSGGMILAAKPQDVPMWQDIFRKAGRSRDLLIFDADGPYRCNFLNYLGDGETRNVVEFMTTVGETLKRGDGRGGGEHTPFYEQQEARVHYNIITALKAAREPIEAPRMHAFLMTAANSPADHTDPAWHRKYHNQVMERADRSPKSPREAHDYQLCKDFWVNEYPNMDPKTRANIVAGVMGAMHVFNTGLVRDMVSGETNVSPDDILAGAWVLVNFPPSSFGAVGAFICAGWKYLTQLAVLKRKTDDRSSFVTLWCDEAHQFVAKPDAPFIAQCRSRLGCMVYLTQSVASFYAAMHSETGRHQADALLANFSHTIVHASDPTTAKWCAAKLGREKKLLGGGGYSPRQDESLLDELMGRSKSFNWSFSEHYEQVLQDQAFQHGLRTGGPPDYEADAIVIKAGQPFSSGKNHAYVAFSQKG